MFFAFQSFVLTANITQRLLIIGSDIQMGDSEQVLTEKWQDACGSLSVRKDKPEL